MILKIFDQSDTVIPKISRGIALGFFDGVHRGHTDLIRTLVMSCCKLEIEPAVFTFAEHPDTDIHRDKRLGGYLNTFEERADLFRKLGVSELFYRHFTNSFRQLSPEAFLNDVIVGELGAKLIVVGEDYRFGYKGQGDVPMLRKWCRDRQVELIVVPDVSIYNERISSTRIRKLIQKGDMQTASSCLGRPFSLKGEVVHGRRIGRAMGFPTANITVADGVIKPAYGVYVTRTTVGCKTYWSISSFGLRPTVNSKDSTPLLETYLYDTKQDLYGETIEVVFLDMLRPEIKFDSLLQLGTQIKEDLEQAYNWHQSSEDGYISARVNQIPIWLLQTKRFAQASLQLVFQHRLDRKNSAVFALLLKVLTASCRKYPSKSALSVRLDYLYGSSIDNHVEKQGDLQTMYLTTDGLISWSDGSSPFADAVDLLFDILLDPLLDESGQFDQMTFISEKNSLISELTALENDRARFAYNQGLNLLCGGQPHGIKATGELDDLREVSLSDLKDAYAKLLSDVPLMICIGGNINSEILENIYEKTAALPFTGKRQEFGSIKPSLLNSPDTVVESDDYRNVEQSRLNLVYTGLPPYFSHQGIVVSLMNSILGGDVHSLLFDKVREQMGLAYSVYSLHSRYLSALVILAGVEQSSTEAAIKAIDDQIRSVSEGNFDERLLATSRELLAGAIEAVSDDLSSMMSTIVNSVILGRTLSRSDSLSLLEAVTKDEIMQMAARLEPKVQYRLLPESLKEAGL